jgi:uncharacterized protein (DUF736 family)
MAYEKKHGDATLFANDRKTKDSQPDWRGSIHIDGKDYELAFWNKISKNGNNFLGGRMGDEVKPPESKGSFPKPQQAKPSVKDSLNDDMPW